MLTFANPAAYIFRNVDQRTYLRNRLGAYSAAMESIHELPENSRVLMLWEPRGYYCQPVCDPDEIIDKWPSDSRKYADSPTITRAWKAQGYTHLLIYNTGKEFVRTEDPQGSFINWTLLDATLRNLRIEKQIEGGSYTLYKLP